MEGGNVRNPQQSNAAAALILVGAAYTVSILAQVLACILSLPIADLATGRNLILGGLRLSLCILRG